MRESLARAIHSTHLEESSFNVPLDKIKAIGFAGMHNPIGAEALHFFDALQAESYQRLIYLLSRRANAKFKVKAPQEMTIKICHQVIREYAFKFCHTCHGRKEVKAGERVITCHQCSGTGLHRHTDLERATALEIPLEAYLKHWGKRYQVVQDILSADMKDSLGRMKILLERY